MYKKICDDIRSNHQKIVRELIEKLPEQAASNMNRDWTDAEKKVMHTLFKKYLKNQGEYCASLTDDKNPSEKFHEWMLDISWYLKIQDVDKKKILHEGLVLALESEWSHSKSEVGSDFCKLLAVKSPIKIMVFGVKESELLDYINLLNNIGKRWIQNPCGEVYYAINFDEKDNHQTYFYECKKNEIGVNFKFNKCETLTGKNAIKKAP
jgi:hypothetical protein